MNDRDRALNLICEGAAYAIREGWVDDKDIEDKSLKVAVGAAYDALTEFEAACRWVEDEAKRVYND